MKNDRTAFTLIELLVVISIIAILAAILLPTVNLVRSQAKQTVCRSQMKQVIASIIAYRTDNEGYLPVFATTWSASDWWSPSTRFQELIEPFLGNYALLNCPVAAKVFPNFNIVDQQTGGIPRGRAQNGFVFNSAVNSQDWVRYGRDPAALWYTNPGPLVEIRVETIMRASLAGAKINRCPVFFDGTWQNDGSNQQINLWGTYFPHRTYANMAFHDGHLEVVRQVDVTNWHPLQVIEK